MRHLSAQKSSCSCWLVMASRPFVCEFLRLRHHVATGLHNLLGATQIQVSFATMAKMTQKEFPLARYDKNVPHSTFLLLCCPPSLYDIVRKSMFKKFQLYYPAGRKRSRFLGIKWLYLSKLDVLKYQLYNAMMPGI